MIGRRLALLSVAGMALAVMCLPLLLASNGAPSCAQLARSDGLDAEQQSNAHTIVAVARRMAMGDEAGVIGVMTALTESSLRNITHGDAAGPDSRGLFQQRDGWGPLEVRLNPDGAAGLFFRALASVPGWSTMPPWRAAQAVQRSAFRDGSDYAASLALARQVVAGLGPAMSQCSNSLVLTAAEERSLPGAAAAVVRARAMIGQHGYYQLCARLAARIWGRSRAGYVSAADQWTAMLAAGHAHVGDRRPPVGALLFWDTGGPYGHVAFYVGAGQIVSNDIEDETPGEGGVYLVDATAIESKWRSHYLGWAPPLYASQ